MGLALIIFTLFINLCLLPLSLQGDDTEDERRELLSDIRQVERALDGYPVKIKKEKEKLISSHRKIVWSRLFSYAVYICYFIVLYRVFKTGLKGADFDLLYKFVRQPELPMNLKFFGSLELTEPSPWLNTISAVLTIPAELLSIIFSELPATRHDWLAVVLAPIAAFCITYSVPSGQELFFTVSLIFIIVVMFTRELFKIFKKKLESA